jgi:hypothetical protein
MAALELADLAVNLVGLVGGSGLAALSFQGMQGLFEYVVTGCGWVYKIHGRVRFRFALLFSSRQLSGLAGAYQHVQRQAVRSSLSELLPSGLDPPATLQWATK